MATGPQLGGRADGAAVESAVTPAELFGMIALLVRSRGASEARWLLGYGLLLALTDGGRNEQAALELYRQPTGRAINILMGVFPEREDGHGG